MKHLQDYIFENIIDIFEASSMGDNAKHNWEHDDSSGTKHYTYAKAVINILLGNDDETMGVNKVTINTGKDELIINNEQKKKLKELLKNIEGSSYSDFDNIVGKGIWRKIDKYPFTKLDVTTRDQEVATSVIFNKLIENNFKFPNKFNYNKDEIKKDKLFEQISILCNDLKGQFDNQWKYSFYYQIAAIIEYIRKNNKDPKNFIIERYDGDKSYKWDMGKKYASVINTYTQKFKGSKKDNWDPTDVILYEEKSKSIIEQILEESKPLINKITFDDNGKCDNSEFKNVFNKLYEDFIFRGLSLKKLNNKCELEEFNINEKVKAKVISYDEIKETNNSIYIKLKGNLTLETPITVDKNLDAENKKETMSDGKNIKNFKLTIRTNGQSIACDVALLKNNESTTAGPSLGKCSTAVWRPLLLGKNNSDKYVKASKIKEVKEIVKNYFTNNDENKIKSTIEDIIESAIKCGPNCLPFVLIH